MEADIGGSLAQCPFSLSYQWNPNFDEDGNVTLPKFPVTWNGKMISFWSNWGGQKSQGRASWCNKTTITGFCVWRRPFPVFFLPGTEKVTVAAAIFRSWGLKPLKVMLRVEEKQERNVVLAGFVSYPITFGLPPSKLLVMAEKLTF